MIEPLPGSLNISASKTATRLVVGFGRNSLGFQWQTELTKIGIPKTVLVESYRKFRFGVYMLLISTKSIAAQGSLPT